MGLKSLFSAKASEVEPPSASQDYIDLEEYAADSELFDATASMIVRSAVLQKYDDLREFANWVYSGNLVLLDISAVAQDEIIMRRVTNDLKKLVSDINGDIAGLNPTTLIVAPTGVRVDRHKARGGSF